MKYYELDKKEEELLKKYEIGDLKNSAGKKNELKKYKIIAQKSLEKTRNVNIRIAEGDLLKIKAIAIQKGIPYQTLLTSLIHQYATHQIKHNVL